MLWNDIATLVGEKVQKDDIGDTVVVEMLRDVFVDKKSIRQTEYYQALSVGLKPELMLVVRNVDYEDEKILIYSGKRYNISRVYTKNGEITELICSGVI